MKYPEQESALLEFKREIPKNDQILKTVIGFCNHKGGKLVVGIDNDGTILGVDDDKIQTALEYLEKSVYEAGHPAIIPLVYTQKIGGKSILIIEVFPGNNKPYFLKSEGVSKGVYIRLGRSTMRASPETIQELGWQAQGRSLDQMPVYRANLDDLNEKTIRDFLHNKKVPVKSKTALNTILCNYNFAVYEHTKLFPTVAGIVLFAKNPQQFFPQAYIVCTAFSGNSLADGKALASRECTGSIVDQFQEAFEFVLQRLSSSYVIKGSRRIDTLEIPERAVREVLINAIAHRNYNLPAPIKIAIFADRIEVFSPGDFHGPLVKHNLLMGLSFIRNSAICKALKEIGIIEAFGIGFTTLFESYRAMHLPVPEVIEGENFIKCILPRKMTPKRASLQSDEAAENILRLFHTATEISINDVIENLHFSRAAAGRKLKDLIAKKLIKTVGKGRTTRYVLY